MSGARKDGLMKLLISSLSLGFAVALAPAADAAVCAHRVHCRLAYGYHHFHHYADVGVYPYPYAPPARYAYAPAYGGYAPGYFYATPNVKNPGFVYGPYPWSWGYRNTLN